MNDFPASLAVQKANYAVKMYKKAGFQIINENEEEYIVFFHGVNSTDSDSAEFDFAKPGQIRPVFISQRLSVSALVDGWKQDFG